MRGLLAFACVLAGCATGTPGSSGDDDIDAHAAPDARVNGTPPDAAEPPDSMPQGSEVSAKEELCNDAFDNDSNGQMDCADAACVFACAALSTACTAPKKLRAYTMAPMPQTIPDVSSVSASIAVTRTGTVFLAAVRFNATHTFDNDIDLTMTSPGATTLDLTSDNGSLDDNYTNTVFIDSAPTSITAGTPPFTGSFQPEAPLSGLVGQTIMGTWSSLLVDDLGSDTGQWTELSLALCVSP